MFGRYQSFHKKFIINDEETGLLLKEIDNLKDFDIDNNYNLILSNYKSIQYLSFNGDLLKEIKIEGGSLLIFDKRCFLYDRRNYRFWLWNKNDEDTHEVAFI